MNNNNFWGETLFSKLYTLPGHPPLDAEHSLVYTFDSSLKYFPIQDKSTISLYAQGIFIILYVILWTIIILQGCKTCTIPYFIGFLTGLIIILLETYFYYMLTNVQLLRTTKKTTLPYISNLPQVDSLKLGEDIGDINKRVYFNTNGGHGDYKILFNNTYLPKSDTYGYILPAKIFLEKSSSGDFQSLDFKKYLEGKAYDKTASKTDNIKYNPGTQNDIEFYSTKITKLSKTAYYIGMIIITWAVYVTNSQWGSTRQLYWNMLTIMLSIIAGAVVLAGQNIVSYNYNIYLKKRLLIMAISLGITSILII